MMKRMRTSLFEQKSMMQLAIATVDIDMLHQARDLDAASHANLGL